MAYPLVGRVEEVSVLRTAVDAATRGAGTFVLIEGPAGVGKTRLVQETTAYARAAGLHVRHGAADELDQGRPFAAIASVTGAAETGAAVRGVEGFVDVVEELSLAGPLLLALEDVHWADHGTLQTLRAIARRVSQFPLVVVVTLRPLPSSDELAATVGDLVDRGGLLLVLDNVREEHAVELATSIVGAPLGPHLRAQIRAAGGSPLYVSELVEALVADAAVVVHGGLADVAAPGVPPSLSQAILRRAAPLPEATRELLKVASILGSSFSLAELAAFTRRQAVDLLPVLASALRAGVIGEADGRLVFRHDLVRQAIYGELPDSVRRDLHRDAGRSLAAAGASAVSIAEQMSLGAVPGDDEAVEWLRCAAREVDAAPAQVATRFLRRALELSVPSDPRRPALMADLALSLLASGRLEEAQDAAQQVLDLMPTSSAARHARLTVATIVFLRGDRAGAAEMMLASAQEADDDEAGLDLALASLASAYAGQPDRALQMAESARQVCAASGDAFGLSRALTTLSLVQRARGRVQEACELGAEGVRVAASAATPLARLYLHPAFALGTACLEADRLDQGEEALRSFGESVGWGGRLDVPWLHGYLAAKATMAGEWDVALAEAEAALARVGELDFALFAGLLLPHGIIATIAFAQGDLARVESALAAAHAEVVRAGPQPGLDVVAWVQAVVADDAGRSEEALAVLAHVWEAYRALGYQIAHRWLAPDLVRLAVRLGDVDRACDVARTMEELAARAGVASARAAALRCRGLLTDDPAVLVAAADAYRESPRLFERALACVDAAIALARDGKADEAERLRREAMSLFDQLGAVGAAARAHARLRAAGVSTGRRGRPARAAVTGWESLTSAERRVVDLVASGMTNRGIAETLCISPRTAETHVAHVLKKLGLTSRSSLAAAVVRRSTQDAPLAAGDHRAELR